MGQYIDKLLRVMMTLWIIAAAAAAAAAKSLQRTFEEKDRIFFFFLCLRGFPPGSVVKNPLQEMKIPSVVWGHPMEKKMATHCSILAWKIPWTEEFGELQSMGMQKSWTPFSD